jgi:hypothetical protein
MILYLFDLFFLSGCVMYLSYFFKLDYLETIITWLLRLPYYWVFYLSILGIIFDVYKLQVASNQFLIARSTIRLQRLLFILTPVFADSSIESFANFNFFLYSLSLILGGCFYVRF